MKVWINGSLVDAAQPAVSPLDHGLVVGDGVFETVKVVHGVPFALTRHLRRLTRSAVGLGLEPPESARVRQAVAELLDSAEPAPHARLRITYTGGVAPLGSERGDGPGTLMLAATPYEPWSEPAVVVTVPFRRNELGALAGLKTTSYAENVVALARARAAGASEALFANTAGMLCEGTATNVFVVSDGRLRTPPLSAGPLAGVTRALILEWYGGEESDLPLSVLKSAEEVFITSTTRDIQPVARVDGRDLAGTPGPVTRAVMKVFAEQSKATDDPV